MGNSKSWLTAGLRHPESWVQNETYETLKAFLQVGGCEPNLRNVKPNAKKRKNGEDEDD